MKSNQEITKEHKQIFLRNQILEAGIDAQCFMDYMGTIKNQGQNIDIDNWQMEELKNLVHSFKQQIKTDREILKIAEQSKIREQDQVMSKIIKSNIFKKEKVHYEKGLWDYEIVNEQQCKSIKKPFNINPKMKPIAYIKSWQVKTQGGFLFGMIGATKQLWFIIETNFTLKPVQRTNSDFEWYRNALVKLNPGAYVPPLAELRSIEAEDKKGIALRVKIIERFINSILQYQYLLQSQISNVFLQEPDHNKLTNYKNKERLVGNPKTIGRIENLEGKFHLEISNRNQKVIRHSSAFGKIAQQKYTEIDIQIKKVLSDMETLSKHILYVSNNCGNLHQKYSKICGLNQIKENKMQSLLSYIQNMLSSIGKSIKDHMEVIKQFSDEFVHYSIQSWQQFLLNDKRHQREVQNYLTFKAELMKKKERYFNDVTKWELQSPQEVEKALLMNLSTASRDDVLGMMFPRQNKSEQQMRVWIAYLNSVYELSFRALLREQQNFASQKLKVYLKKSLSLKNEKDFSQQLLSLLAMKE